MDLDIPDELVDVIRSEVGDDLRTVGQYRNGELDFGYLRSDVADQYSDEDFERISELFVFQAYDSEQIEEHFEVGEVEFFTYGLRDAVVFQYVADPLAGCFISVDAEANPLPGKLQDRLIGFLRSEQEAAREQDREPIDDLQELFSE